jgi:hypothetical protein
MTFYITKSDVLKTGIIESNAAKVNEHDPEVLFLREKGYSFLKVPFWHRTREQAVAHCKKIRAIEVKRLKNRIKELESKVF